MTFRKGLFWLHLIAGVVAGSVILVMSVTGFLLAFERQILAFAERSYLAQPAEAATPRLALDDLLARAREAVPEGAPTNVTLKADPAAPASVSFGREKTVFLNPYTGAFLGEGSRLRGVFNQITQWHRWLGSREIGKPVTGACNAAFAILVVTGVFLWCPRRWPWHWNWQKLKPSLLFNTALRGKARDWNWHNVIGIWCAPVLLVLTLTAVVMSYPWANNLVYTLTGNEPPAQAQRPGGPGGRGGRGGRGQAAEGKSPSLLPPGVSLDPLFAAAQKQAPDWESISLPVPQRGSKSVAITVQEGKSWHPYARSSLTLEPRSAATIQWEPFESQNAGRKARLWIRFLHTGEALGIVGQAVAALACAGGAVLVWTGLSLAWRRFRGRGRKRPEPAPAEEILS